MKYSSRIARNAASTVIKRLFRLGGLEVHRYRGVRTSMFQALKHLSDRGYSPHTVFDVGVGYGTTGLYESFPDAFFVLVEPVAEFEPHIRSYMAPYQYLLIQACAGENDGSTLLAVGSRLTGSSTLITGNRGQKRTVSEITLDSLCQKYDLEEPFLIKTDVEGAELKVLHGASSIMNAVEVVVLEVTFIPGRIGAPDFTEIVTTMGQLGFVVYDLINLRNREGDDTLIQADAVFVRRDSRLRQRASLNEVEETGSEVIHEAFQSGRENRPAMGRLCYCTECNHRGREGECTA